MNYFKEFFVTNKATMKRAEELAVLKGESWFGLMQNAGSAAAEFILSEQSLSGKKVLILCGKGNNGGDGFIIAQKLAQNGALVSVCMPLGIPATESAKQAHNLAFKEQNVIRVETFSTADYDLVIDALLGTGCSGNAPDENLAKTLLAVKIFDYAVDIPSLIETDSGIGAEFAVPAKTTLALGAVKPCHVTPKSAEKCGRIICLDIGIADSIFEVAGATIKTIAPYTPKPRAKTAHKNNFGVAVSVCGSFGMSGASVLAAKACLRSGVGILKVATIKENYSVLATSAPEAVLIPLKSKGKTFSKKASKPILAELKKANALLIGCGLGVSKHTKKLTRNLLKKVVVPTILDADGINIAAKRIKLLQETKADLILTPHSGEMARLLGVTPKQVEENRIGIAAAFAKKHGVCLVLKGANTVVADKFGNVWVNLNGNSGMATAGSGDCLAGITLALLANGLSTSEAARAAVWLHAAAGDSAKELFGETAMLPSDMIDQLHKFL